MLTKQRVQRLLKENSQRFATEYGVSRIGLFGSITKGEFNQDSDVDLFVEFTRPIGFKFIQFAEEIESLLGRKVDILTPGGLNGIRVPTVSDNIAKSITYV